MLAERGLELGSGALAERGDNGLVFALFLIEAGFEGREVGAFRGVDACDLDVGVEALVDFEEFLRAGDFEELAVEVEIGAFVTAAFFFAADGLGEILEEGIEADEIRFGNALGGAHGGERFESGADLKGLFDFFDGYGSDICAAAGVNFNEALDGELAQRVPDGGEAHAEFAGEIVGEEALAGEE